MPVATVDNNLRFSGQYWDAETGLSQNWWREYSPALGRYYQPDHAFQETPRPRRCKRSVERAIYAKLHPLDSLDPKGLTELLGFPGGTAAALNSSLMNAMRGLKHCCECIACKDAANKLLQATIRYDPNLNDCGITWRFINPNDFWVGPGTLPGGSCCTAQTFAEEALHLAGLSDSNNEAGQVAARCAPCR